ncbi:MAG: alanine racemase [Patescibacteria group bacterium]|jgi:alanine racemase
MVALPGRKQYKHLNRILVSKNALLFNHNQLLASQPGLAVAPVLKSNAYGHGLKTVAPIFDSFSPAFLAVDSLYEAYELNSLHLKTPILILGYTDPQNYVVKRLPFHFTIFDIESARALNKGQRNCPVHIFVDTGMHREGVMLDKLEDFVRHVKQLKNLRIVGLASHLADADNPHENTFTYSQVACFKQALQILRKNEVFPQWRHISASGGAHKVKDDVFNLVRAGIVSYGISPLEKSDRSFGKIDLKPVLSFMSTIAQIKPLKKGEKVGYSCTFTATKDMVIGVIPAGYYDGIDRRLSNKGLVLVKNTECKILGRISMNITAIDLSGVKKPEVGDEVIIISDIPTAKNCMCELARICKTIPYDLMVHLAESLKREIV